MAVTGDFLRLQPRQGRYDSSQRRNVAWLFEVLTGSEPWQRPGLEVELLFPDHGAPLAATEALGPEIAEAFERNAELAWSELYSAPSVEVFPTLMSRLAQADLVVGFELAPSLKRSLHRLGRTYLSVHVHALRMLSDLCFGATTNSPAIASALQLLRVTPAAVTRAVHHHRALCRFHNLPVLRFPSGLPVVIGQTARDSVLIEGGRFSGWQDHDDATAAALRGHDAVILLEHPYRQRSLDIAEHLRSRHGKSVLSTTANGYGVLFTNRDIPLALTLSSSLGVEAEAAGVATRFLLGDPRQRLQVPALDLGPLEPLGHGFLSAAFWGPVLEGNTVSEASLAADPFGLGPDYLRSCLDAWSYRLLHNGLAGASNRTCLIPAPDLRPERAQQLVDGLGRDELSEAPAAWRRAGIELVELDPPLQQGEVREVDFGRRSALGYLGSGFHAVERAGAWSISTEALLNIPISRQAVDSGCVVTACLTLSPAKGMLEQSPAVCVSMDGAPLGYAFFRPGQGKTTHQLSVTWPARETCAVLNLSTAELCAKTAGGDGGAVAAVGFLLSDMRLTCAPEEGDSTRQASGVGVVGIGGDPEVISGAGTCP